LKWNVVRRGPVNGGVRVIKNMRSDLPSELTSILWPQGWNAIGLSNESSDIECASYMECLVTGQAAASTYVDELNREMCAAHKLNGRILIPIGQSTIDPDDLLFYTDDPTEPFVFVHLTWHVETCPDFPYAKTYKSLNDLFADWVENP
jgi:hypothetical protein